MDLSAAGMTPAQAERAVAALLHVSEVVAGNLELDAVLESSMLAAASTMEAEASSLLLTRDDRAGVQFHLADGERAGALSGAEIPAKRTSIAGWVAEHGQGLIVEDPYQDPRFNPDYDRRTGFTTRSVLCAPLTAKGRQLGVIQILNRRDGQPFAEADLRLLTAIAALIAMAIYNAEEVRARLAAERFAAVGQAIAGMAHCIKNILTGLQGGSYIVDRSLPKDVPDSFLRGWAMVRRNLQLLTGIVLDMLSYSKERAPFYEECPPEELCRAANDVYGETAADRGVEIRTRVDGELKAVMVDIQSMRRVLINLVGNAVEACPDETGLVEVSLVPTADGNAFTISVKDNGSGIPAQAREKIFQPLFSTKGGAGTGLGLSVTRKIVQEHRGTIAVTSTEGEGTEFILTLPMSGPRAD